MTAQTILGRSPRTPWLRMAVPAVAAVLLLAAPLSAQDRRDRRPEGRDRQELERRVRAQIDRMIQEELGLTDAESASLSEIMGAFQERRRDLARSERVTRRRVEALMREDGDNQTEAAELLQRMVDFRAEEGRLFEEEQTALLQLLTPVQVLQLHAVRERLRERLRSLRNRRGGDDRGDRGPGWPQP